MNIQDDNVIKQITIAVAAAFVIGVGSLNGWSWEIAAIATELTGLEQQLKITRIERLEAEIYDLEKLKDLDDNWSERDEKRLIILRLKVERGLEALDED